MKKLALFFLLFSLSGIMYGQVNGGDAAGQNSDLVFTIVQQMPKFRENIQDYLASHITYPEAERKANITGTVYVTFIVEKDGSVSSAKVLRGVPNGPGLDSTAVAVISNMPKWTPGMQNGHQVRVQYNLPIHFELEDNPPAKKP